MKHLYTDGAHGYAMADGDIMTRYFIAHPDPGRILTILARLPTQFRSFSYTILPDNDPGPSIPSEQYDGFPEVKQPDTGYIFYRHTPMTPIRDLAVPGGGISVMITPGDSNETIRLRIWHELLHIEDDGQHNPDHMEQWIGASFWRWIVRGTGLFSEETWQRMYYEKLTKAIL